MADAGRASGGYAVLPDDSVWVELPAAVPGSAAGGAEAWAEDLATSVAAKLAPPSGPAVDAGLLGSLASSIVTAQADRPDLGTVRQLLLFAALDRPPIPVQVAVWAATAPWRRAKWAYLGGDGAGFFRRPKTERVGILDTPAGALRSVRQGTSRADPTSTVARVVYAWRRQQPEVDCQVVATLAGSEVAAGLAVLDRFVRGIVIIEAGEAGSGLSGE